MSSSNIVRWTFLNFFLKRQASWNLVSQRDGRRNGFLFQVSRFAQAMVASLEKSRHGPCSVYFRQLLGHSAAAELVWRTVQLQPNTSPGSDDEAQSRPSRASRTRFCRPFPLSFLLRPTWKASPLSLKDTSFSCFSTHTLLSQKGPSKLRQAPSSAVQGSPMFPYEMGWVEDPGSGAQIVTSARHLQALNSANTPAPLSTLPQRRAAA